MKEVIAIIRMNAIQNTKIALSGVGLDSMTAERVYGRGKQKGLHIYPLGKIDSLDSSKEGMKYVPKRMLTFVVPDDRVDELTDILIKTNKTGMIGDGKIFISDVEDAIRIRTGDQGLEAL